MRSGTFDPIPTPFATDPMLTKPEIANAPRKPRDVDLDVFGLSHRGSVRKVNQDHYMLATIN